MNPARLVVRNGSHQPREVLTSAGAVEVVAPRVNDRRSDPETGERVRFCSAILPPWCRKTPKITEVLPLLYLHGLSSGEVRARARAVPRLHSRAVRAGDHQVDPGVVRAHQHAAGARHQPAGHRHDSLAFEPVMAGIMIGRRGRGRPRTRPGQVLGDKAYSSRSIRAHLRRRRITATIPEPADQVNNRLRRGRKGGRPPGFDPEQYKERNTVERAINKLKGHRAVATRYDERDYMFRGTIDVASVRIWLRDPVP